MTLQQLKPLASVRTLLLLGGLFFCGREAIAEWDAHTAIDDVTMSNPTANEVWLMDTPHTLTCNTANDNDRWRSGPTDGWTVYVDSVTHYWTGTGQFKNNNNIGTSVDYIAPQPGNDSITVYADDNYGMANSALVDEMAKNDSETVTVVGVTVYRVGFTGDNALYRTPANQWDVGTAAITDPIWISGGADNAATNHVCYTKGSTPTTTFKCKVSTALTEGSTFEVGPYTNISWSWGSVSIGAGDTESSEGTSTQSAAFANSIWKGNWALTWVFKCSAGANVQRTLNSTSHSLYITWGAPSPGGAESTVRRIDHVTTHCNGNTSTYQIADNLQDAAGTGTTPGHNQANQSDYWDLYYNVKEGECDEHARFMVRQLEMIGSSGSAYNTYASRDAAVTTMETFVFNGETWKLLMDFDSDGIPDNNFEGSVSSGGHYWTVWPKYDANSEVNLLRAITCKQWWGRWLGDTPIWAEEPKP